LGSADCRPNFYVIVSSQPAARAKAFIQRDPTKFHVGSRIDKFLHATIPIRVSYQTWLYSQEGTPLTEFSGQLSGIPVNPRAEGLRLTRDDVLDLTEVIELIDAPRVKGVTFGQLAAYIAIVGLAQVRLDANMADAPSILQLFSTSGNTPPAGLSPWDLAFIKALYRTRHTDPAQLGEIKISMVKDLAP
jgi:hypothetical protein